jgi:hypothetical protein
MSDEQANVDRRATQTRQTIPFRPLLGMHQNVSSTLVPKGAFIDANGYMPSRLGLVRRFCFSPITYTFPNITRWDYLDAFINDDGSKVSYGIGDGKFYELAGTAFIERPNHYPNINTSDPTGAGRVSLTTGSVDVTGVSTHWLDEGCFIRGDMLNVEVSPGVYKAYQINSTISNTQLTLYDASPDTIASAKYYVERIMKPAVEWAIKVVRLDRLLYICTGQNTIMIYDIDDASAVYTWLEYSKSLGIIGTGPGQYDPQSPNFIPKAIEAFKDRIWTGNIESDFDNRLYPGRVSWTPILSPTIFLPETQYVDLVLISGEIGSLNILGNFLMAYFEFGVQYGRETAIPGDVFPLAFDHVETGRRGAVQPNAVISAVGGNFFASTDNIYFINGGLQVSSISDEVAITMFRKEVLKTSFKVMAMSEAEGLAVGASTYEEAFEDLWIYDYDTKEWTHVSLSADHLASFAIGSRLVFADYPAGQIYGGPTEDYVGPCNTTIWDTTRAASAPYYFTTYDVQHDDMSNGLAKEDPAGGNLGLASTLVPIYGVIDPILGEQSRYETLTAFTECKLVYGFTAGIVSSNRFFITNGAPIYVYDRGVDVDYDGSPVTCVFETGDLDMNLPDDYKTFYKIAMRIQAQAPARIVYKVRASDDSGVTWYAMGNLVINAGGKEGRCNFIHTGTASRFRLVSDSAVLPYIITELTIDVRIRGSQVADY